jgi:hypothetical protein
MESGNQFVHEVKAMRDAQNKYFITRKSKDLKNAKKHESMVDDFLKAIFKKNYVIEPTQKEYERLRQK